MSRKGFFKRAFYLGMAFTFLVNVSPMYAFATENDSAEEKTAVEEPVEEKSEEPEAPAEEEKQEEAKQEETTPKAEETKEEKKPEEATETKTEETKTEEVKEEAGETLPEETLEEELPEEELPLEELPLEEEAVFSLDDAGFQNWDKVSKHSADGDKWAIALGDGGVYLYTETKGAAQKQASIDYSDGTQGSNNGLVIKVEQTTQTEPFEYKAGIMNGWWQDISGASAKSVSDGSTVYTEAYVPMDFFANGDFTIKLGGSSVKSADVDSFDDTEFPSGTVGGWDPSPVAGAVYSGITVDGDVSDWDAIRKVEVDESAYKSWECLYGVAMVFDGDWVYLYFAEPEDLSATGAGTHNNGQYVITTDLGNELKLQLTRDGGGSVSGVTGAKVAHSDHSWGLPVYYWEVAVPKSELPTYRETISFGLYQGQTFISDMANKDGSKNEVKTGPITYDGSYGDWEGYPHTLIQYATAGTQVDPVDAEGALTSANGYLYGHVRTTMPAHLEEAGGEFTSAVTIRLNDAHDFYPQFVTVDSAGNINYSPKLSGLSNGTYEFYMIDSQGWKTAKTVGELEECNNALYGKMKVTIGASKDEMEYEAYIGTMAEKFNMDGNDVKTLKAQYGRIGQEWLQTAGTSTGPVLGILLCLAAVAGAGVYQKYGKKPEFMKAAA